MDDAGERMEMSYRRCRALIQNINIHLDRCGKPRCALDLLQRASGEQKKLMKAASGNDKVETGSASGTGWGQMTS